MISGLLQKPADTDLQNFDLRPQGYKKNSCSTQLGLKFIMFINVKMPTIVGILTFFGMINTKFEF